MTATMTTTTPEEKREHFQARKPLLEAKLHEKVTARGTAHLALVRAIGIGPATDEEIVELRATHTALAGEVEELTGALEHLNAELAALAPVVDQREAERLTERAAELRADFAEAAGKISPLVKRFALEKYKPLVEAARAARHAAVEAETAARKAQGMHREDVFNARYDVGHITCGNPFLDDALNLLAFPPPVNPNLPEQIRARERRDSEALQGQDAPAHGITEPSRDHAVHGDE